MSTLTEPLPVNPMELRPLIEQRLDEATPVELGAVLHILPLEQIAPTLVAMLNAEFGVWNKSNVELKMRSVE